MNNEVSFVEIKLLFMGPLYVLTISRISSFIHLLTYLLIYCEYSYLLTHLLYFFTHSEYTVCVKGSWTVWRHGRFSLR